MQLDINDLSLQIKELDKRIIKLEEEISLNAKTIKELDELLELFINKFDINNSI